MDLSKRRAALEFIEKLGAHVVSLITSGQYDYQQCYSQLDKFMMQARQMNSLYHVGSIAGAFVTLHWASGEIDEAFAAADMAVQTYESDGNVMRWQQAIHRRAMLYNELGHDQFALDQLLGIIHDIECDDTLLHSLADTDYLKAAVGRCYISLGELEAAEAPLFDVAALDGFRAERYTPVIAEAYRGFSEVCYWRGESNQALSTAEHALRLAKRTENHTLRFNAACSVAHAVQMTAPAEAKPYYEQALAALAPIGSPMLRGVALLQEARFHHRHSNHSLRQQFASLTRRLLASAGVTVFDPELHTMILEVRPE